MQLNFVDKLKRYIAYQRSPKNNWPSCTIIVKFIMQCMGPYFFQEYGVTSFVCPLNAATANRTFSCHIFFYLQWTFFPRSRFFTHLWWTFFPWTFLTYNSQAPGWAFDHGCWSSHSSCQTASVTAVIDCPHCPLLSCLLFWVIKDTQIHIDDILCTGSQQSLTRTSNLDEVIPQLFNDRIFVM